MANSINNSASENGEENKRNKLLLEKRFIIDFCNQQLGQDFNKNNFLNNIFEKGELPTELMSNLLLSNNNKYSGLKLEHITLDKLKRQLLSEYFVLKNSQDNLNKLIINSYELDNKNKSIINNSIKELSDSQLIDFIKNEKNRNKFIKKELGDKIKEKRINAFLDVFPLSKENSDKILLLSDIDRNLITSTIHEIKNGKLTDSGLKILIKTDFLNEAQKKEIVKNLIPTISLFKAKELLFLNDKESKKIKIELLKKYFKEAKIDYDNRFEDIIDKINDEHVLLSTEDFLSTNENVLKIAEHVGFAHVEKEFIEHIEDIEQSDVDNGPNNLISFKNKLKEYKNVKGSNNLNTGSILKFIIKGKNGIYIEDFLRIESYSDDNKTLNCSQVGKKESKDSKTIINLSGLSTIEKKYYEYLSILDNKNGQNDISLDILSSDNFKDLITNKDEYEVDKDNLDLLTENDIRNNKDIQEKLMNNLSQDYNERLEKLNLELSDLSRQKNVIQKSSLDSSIKKSKLDDLNIKINQTEIIINSIENEKNTLFSGNLSEDEKIKILTEKNNFNELLDQINSINPEGKKIGLGKGVILESDNGFFEVTGVDFENQLIYVDSKLGLEALSYEIFFQSFKFAKAKRSKKINNFEEILQSNEWNNEFYLKNGKIKQKDVELNGTKEDREVDYLVNEKGELLKIVSIGNGEVELIFGDLTEGKKGKDTKKTNNKIELEDTSITISYSQLNKYIKDNKYKPDWKIGKNYTITGMSGGYKNNIKGNLGTRLFNRLSLTDVISAGKMGFDGIVDYLKRGNDLKSAELAMQLIGVFGGDFSEDFVAQTEAKQQEAMDKELSALGKIGSSDAFLRIEKRITNKDTPNPKIEAGLMQSAKYGILYPKELAKYNGTFLWYEVLGGKIGDKRYEDEKEKSKKAGKPFDEKELLIGLLGAQSGGYTKPKRRSKFFKEFKGKIAGGFGEEKDTGYKDANDKNDVSDMNTGGMAEIKGGTIPNGLGWAKRVVEKGGDLKEMNELYFTLIHSGGLDNASTVMLEELKNHWTSHGNGMITALFCSKLKGQKIFNKTVRDISIDIEALEPDKYKGLASKAKKLYNDSEKKNGNYQERINNSNNFWKEYGDVLSRTLFMADGKVGDSDKYLKTDKIIEFGREDKYKDYFDFIKSGTCQATAFKKDYMEDDVGASGVTGIDNFEIIKKYYRIDASRTFKSDNASVIDLTWGTIWGDVQNTKNRVEADIINANLYKKYLNKKLREISAGLLSSSGKEYMSTLNVIDPCGLDLASIGITLTDLKDFRISDIKDGIKGKDIFEKAVDNVIYGNTVNINRMGNVSIFGSTDATIDEIRTNTEEIISFT